MKIVYVIIQERLQRPSQIRHLVAVGTIKRKHGSTRRTTPRTNEVLFRDFQLLVDIIRNEDNIETVDDSDRTFNW